MVIIKHLLLPLLVICCALEFELARASDDLAGCGIHMSGPVQSLPVPQLGAD
ncbi:hypothetical protein ACFW0H_24720 [Pseudomonas sp. CR3202]|uniref:hypothetical protein n=1 Tax=Pseudomonas sp. CR3202 TaxID=3351532 RepID=UPI003BF3F1F2